MKLMLYLEIKTNVGSMIWVVLTKTCLISQIRKAIRLPSPILIPMKFSKCSSDKEDLELKKVEVSFSCKEMLPQELVVGEGSLDLLSSHSLDPKVVRHSHIRSQQAALVESRLRINDHTFEITNVKIFKIH